MKEKRWVKYKIYLNTKWTKKIYHQKYARFARKILPGEKNGNHPGIKLYIVLKDAEEIKILMYKKNLPQILISLGSLPFILLSVLNLLSYEKFLSIDLDYIFSIYSLSIVCFISGSHWGLFLSNRNLRINLFFLSNIITLLCFFGILFLKINYFLYLQIINFFVLLLVDYYIYKKNIVLKEYLKFRFIISFFVIICIAIFIFS